MIARLVARVACRRAAAGGAVGPAAAALVARPTSRRLRSLTVWCQASFARLSHVATGAVRRRRLHRPGVLGRCPVCHGAAADAFAGPNVARTGAALVASAWATRYASLGVAVLVGVRSTRRQRRPRPRRRRAVACRPL